MAIPQQIAAEIKQDTKKSYRVKGKPDQHKVGGLALVPMGGDFILALNTNLRKKIRKKLGDTLQLQLEEDTAVIQLPEDLPPSHRLYYGRWINSAKTEATRTRRIAQAIDALAQSKDYGTMIREGQKEKGEGLG